MAKSNNDNPGCLASLFGFIDKKSSGYRVSYTAPDRFEKDEPLPYRVRDDFLTPSELSFYRVLLHITGTSLTVCPKIRLADLFFVAEPNKNRKFFNYIVGKHIDFLLCAPETMRPLLAIELDDSSHSNANRMERDEFVDRACKDASIPLLRVPTRRQYTTSELTALLLPYLPKPVPTPVPEAQPATAPVVPAAVQPTQEPSAPVCSKCEQPMLLRTVSQGEHKGKKFYGCRNYPHCREVRPYRMMV